MARSGNESGLVQKVCWSITFERGLFIFLPLFQRSNYKPGPSADWKKTKLKQTETWQRRLFDCATGARTDEQDTGGVRHLELEITFRKRPFLVIATHELWFVEIQAYWCEIQQQFWTSSVLRGKFYSEHQRLSTSFFLLYKFKLHS